MRYTQQKGRYYGMKVGDSRGFLETMLARGLPNRTKRIIQKTRGKTAENRIAGAES
jgi:hypothetical protein